MESRDYQGNTGMHIGAAASSLGVLSFLLDHGADREARNKNVSRTRRAGPIDLGPGPEVDRLERASPPPQPADSGTGPGGASAKDCSREAFALTSGRAGALPSVRGRRRDGAHLRLGLLRAVEDRWAHGIRAHGRGICATSVSASWRDGRGEPFLCPLAHGEPPRAFTKAPCPEGLGESGAWKGLSAGVAAC